MKDQNAPNPLTFIHDLSWEDLSDKVRLQIELNLLDLIGVGAGGRQTRLSEIICTHAAQEFGGDVPMLFDHRTASASGVALAAGMTIDSLDGHDGFNPAKGHIGCPLFPAALAIAHQQDVSGKAFLEAMVMGYEFGARVSVAQHATAPDYHTSGSWGAVAAAAAGARVARLDAAQTRHALGTAEYHGPRSQMMRCIDHPTMVKDGAGWGAMAGVSAVRLAQSGFTGAPAITVEQAPEFWADLGNRWYTLEQYYKPYPVCRWAQAPIEGVLALKNTHGLSHEQVDHIEVQTFHESVRLATASPRTTEEAQYSTSFPCAVAMVRGQVGASDIADNALDDPDILRLSQLLVMHEDDYANRHFPVVRYARVTLVLKDGRTVEGDWLQPLWDHRAPPTEAELRNKFHGLADPVLGKDRADATEEALSNLSRTGLAPLTTLLFAPA